MHVCIVPRTKPDAIVAKVIEARETPMFDNAPVTPREQRVLETQPLVIPPDEFLIAKWQRDVRQIFDKVYVERLRNVRPNF